MRIRENDWTSAQTVDQHIGIVGRSMTNGYILWTRDVQFVLGILFDSEDLSVPTSPDRMASLQLFYAVARASHFIFQFLHVVLWSTLACLLASVCAPHTLCGKLMLSAIIGWARKFLSQTWTHSSFRKLPEITYRKVPLGNEVPLGNNVDYTVKKTIG